jgi:hypothetical protein
LTRATFTRWKNNFFHHFTVFLSNE